MPLSSGLGLRMEWWREIEWEKNISYQLSWFKQEKEYNRYYFSLWFLITTLRNPRKVKGYWIFIYCCLFTNMFTASQLCRAEMELSSSPTRSKHPSGPTSFNIKVPEIGFGVLSECWCENSLQHIVISRWFKLTALCQKRFGII